MTSGRRIRHITIVVIVIIVIIIVIVIIVIIIVTIITDLAGRSVDVGVVAAHRPAVRPHHISLHHVRASAWAKLAGVTGHPVLVGKGPALSVHDARSA